MSHNIKSALELADELAADEMTSFTFDEVQKRAGRSRTATANLLKRMLSQGLICRVRHGHYVLRQLGILGTSAAAEDIALAVGAAFAELKHRIAYRSALDEHDLLSHPSRSIQVAAIRRVRSDKISDRPLQVIIEPENTIHVGATQRGTSHVSDLERAVLDSCVRPELVGGAAVIAEALVAASAKINIDQLQQYADRLETSAAIRRLASIADRLEIQGLSGNLKPLLAPKGDIALEPGTETTQWRDSKWRVRWNVAPEELASVVYQ